MLSKVYENALILGTFLAVHNQFVIAFSDCARLLFMFIIFFLLACIFFLLIAPYYVVKKLEGFISSFFISMHI